ncbi:GNAT family N-acetyltransferase [Curtobacterium sp. RRHDQ10]|uniref:GNAT family N-acetyltransferase n=1 Tax=Curtobacterium phyllosphaerae TaxID=3413379 RepID=UPI003BF37FB7
MITIERVSWDDPRGVALRAAMDEDMHVRYARPADDPEPKDVTDARDRALSVDPDRVVTSILAIDEAGVAVGHIAVRRLRTAIEGAEPTDELELKRLMVLDSARGKGAASALLAESESVGREVGAARLILQTGDKQPEAVALYGKQGWRRIENYEPYAAVMPFSICFAKDL